MRVAAQASAQSASFKLSETIGGIPDMADLLKGSSGEFLTLYDKRHLNTGISMVDDVLRTDEAAPRPENAAASQIAVLAGLAALGTLATNILLPSLPQMAEALRVTSATVTSAITVFLVVFALGQLVVGPISDSYGRRWPVFAGFAVFVAGSIWCASSSTLASLLIGRMIQAAGACSTSVLSRAIARDLFRGATLGRAMALIMIAMAAAPGSGRERLSAAARGAQYDAKYGARCGARRLPNQQVSRTALNH